jgi:hypothetical protein
MHIDITLDTFQKSLEEIEADARIHLNNLVKENPDLIVTNYFIGNIGVSGDQHS